MHQEVERPDYCNEQIVQRKRLPPRSYWLPEQKLVLNGRWDFHYAPSPVLTPAPSAEIVTPSTDTSEQSLQVEEATWSQITVPGHWQLQGHGHPHYTNIPYPFPGKDNYCVKMKSPAHLTRV